ncbi:hypothetical protein SHM_03940 [Spiroplasma ixodetis]|uniref:Uncharacterized protein n=1 Tax=Spiroplasma ixodetis TaxID=2141 RepID=A0ABM8BST9_9MOLU|nr:hypothetical protein SHM_03940 [Spiroplasma ixodetis]
MDFKEIIKYALYIGGFCLILWFCRNWIREGIEKYKHRKHIKENDSEPDCIFVVKILKRRNVN